LDRARGHKNTLLPFLQRSFRPAARPETTPVRLSLEDGVVGPVELSGEWLAGDPDAHSGSEAVIGVHGLGGSTESVYMTLLLRACQQSGRPCLLLNTRGAERSGQDIAHAGLIEDLEAAVDAPELSGATSIDVFGYSLGGQLALKYAATRPSPRVRRIAAIGSPLLLDASATAFDRPGVSVYRRHVLTSLKEIYAAAYQRNPRGILPEEARSIRYIREWDERVVAPRFGFQSASHYYASVSAGLVLDHLERDAIYVGAPSDPMVPPGAVAPALPAARLSAFWDEFAGHLGFGPTFDLGFSAPLGLESQVLCWLSSGAVPDER
jgi:hypothetical protein